MNLEDLGLVHIPYPTLTVTQFRKLDDWLTVSQSIPFLHASGKPGIVVRAAHEYRMQQHVTSALAYALEAK